MWSDIGFWHLTLNFLVKTKNLCVLHRKKKVREFLHLNKKTCVLLNVSWGFNFSGDIQVWNLFTCLFVSKIYHCGCCILYKTLICDKVIRSQNCTCSITFVLIPLSLTLIRGHLNLSVQKGGSRHKSAILKGWERVGNWRGSGFASRWRIEYIHLVKLSPQTF